MKVSFARCCQAAWPLIDEGRHGSSRPYIAPADVAVALASLGSGAPATQRVAGHAHVGGSRGMDELVRRVRSGEMAAAVALYPTRMSDVMAVADAGGIMPPKSTWFAPKLVDGLISHVLD